jgi:toxin-antitoxin system PIN domain toxin
LILVDVNLLIYAVAAETPQHQAARKWFDDQLNGSAKVGLPWPSLLGFLRLISNRRLFERAMPLSAAWQVIESWRAQECVWTPAPTSRHAVVLGELIGREVNRHDLVPDAHLAALAIEHGLVLCSTDGDFARFRELQWRNPLAP